MSTIKDVARLAGVGVATASRAMTGRGPVAPATAQRVRDAAAQLDYRPSAIARALSTQRTDAIGIYVPDFSGTFHGSILARSDAVLRAAHRHMVVANGCGDGDRRQQALDGIEFLMARECDGLIVCSNELTEADLIALNERVRHLVVLNRNLPALGERAFAIDHEAGGRLVGEALLRAGRRRVAVIGGREQFADNQARLRGLHAALEAGGAPVPPQARLVGHFSLAGGEAAAHELLAQGVAAYDALFCANDTMAVAATSVLAAAGVRIPAELAVVGYDDDERAPYNVPPLTTVHVPIAELATQACRSLLHSCYGLEAPPPADFRPHLVWRQSLPRPQGWVD
jgi:LacI family transcriptional regulator